MSRIGKKPIEVPAGIEAKLNGNVFTVKASGNELTFAVPAEVIAKMEGNVVTFEPINESKSATAKWGLSRAICANMVEGLHKGFEKKLTMKGVGYKAAMKGDVLEMQLGFSHPIIMPVPKGLKVVVSENVNVSVSGFDKQQVGQFAAEIRMKRPPEPYKGKGVRYVDEHVVQKEGKKK